MKDYLCIGPVPSQETYAQVGTEDYQNKAKKECLAFARQLQRAFSNPPAGCSVAVKPFSHDFGTYYEVVIFFDDRNEESVKYAYNMENNTPENWDAAAVEELTGIKSKVTT